MEVVEEVGQGDSLSGHTSDTSSKPSLTNEDVASFLLDRSLPLTALEFYQELLEEGCELEILHNYFEKQVPLRREPSFDSFSDSTSSHSGSIFACWAEILIILYRFAPNFQPICQIDEREGREDRPSGI